MGLLDDAIRQHLELKRRSGEDSRRLAQLEHEAFGPIRRGDPALELSPPGEGGEDEPLAAREAEPSPAPVEDDLGWEVDEDEPEFEAPVAREPEPPARRFGAAGARAHPRARLTSRPEPALRASSPATPEASAPPEAIDQPTAAYSISELEALRERTTSRRCSDRLRAARPRRCRTSVSPRRRLWIARRSRPRRRRPASFRRMTSSRPMMSQASTTCSRRRRSSSRRRRSTIDSGSSRNLRATSTSEVAGATRLGRPSTPLVFADLRTDDRRDAPTNRSLGNRRFT